MIPLQSILIHSWNRQRMKKLLKRIKERRKENKHPRQYNFVLMLDNMETGLIFYPCISSLLVTRTEILTTAAQRRRGLFWLGCVQRILSIVSWSQSRSWSRIWWTTAAQFSAAGKWTIKENFLQELYCPNVCLSDPPQTMLPILTGNLALNIRIKQLTSIASHDPCICPGVP